MADKHASVSIVDLNPAWVSGFIDGEGCFYVYVSVTKPGKRQTVDLTLEISQNGHDGAILQSIAQFFGSGYLSPAFDYTSLDKVMQVRSKVSVKVRDANAIAAFLAKHPLFTRKRLDAEDFMRIHALKQEGVHLNPAGLARIRAIKAGINRGRA